MRKKSGQVGERVSNRLLFGALLAFLILLFAPLFFYIVEHIAQLRRPQRRRRLRVAVSDAVRGHVAVQGQESQLGFVAYWTVRVAGVSLVAFTTAAIASRFVATVIKRGAGWATFKGSNHLLICGWSAKGVEIIRELRAKEVEDRREIVILADRDTDPLDEDGITFIRGNPSSDVDLRRAGDRSRVNRHRAGRRLERERRSRRPRRARRCSRRSPSNPSTRMRTPAWKW